MSSISRLTSLALLTALAVVLAGCMHAEDPITQYTKRADTITLSAGNAAATNEAIQTIDPWPRASANRNIPGNGERMAGAYERYRNVDKVPPRPMLNPPYVGTGGAMGGAGGAAATPAK